MIKRTAISEFDSIRANGKKFITLKDDDELISVKKTTGEDEILMASSNGRMVRFNESGVRVMGRSASGVKGINLDGGVLVGMEIAQTDGLILTVTEKGYGKKTPTEEYRITSRGGKGVKTVNITDKNGSIVAFKTVDEGKDVMIITDSGIVIRLDADKISTMSRVTQGVRLINLKDEQTFSSTAIIEKNEEIYTLANQIKNDFYGNRIVLFAPLYLSNFIYTPSFKGNTATFLLFTFCSLNISIGITTLFNSSMFLVIPIVLPVSIVVITFYTPISL